MRSDPRKAQLRQHVGRLRSCSLCPSMSGPVVIGTPILSKMMLIGQAPGDREGKLGRPFAWTAGKTLFRWFAGIGITEDAFRERVYMAAVCRCFPGKNPKGGDRVPSPEEIGNCSRFLEREIDILRPQLVVPVGRLAIRQFLPEMKLEELIGKRFVVTRRKRELTLIPLPHPSGASTWHRMEPGKTLLQRALSLIERDPTFRAITAATERRAG